MSNIDITEYKYITVTPINILESKIFVALFYRIILSTLCSSEYIWVLIIKIEIICENEI